MGSDRRDFLDGAPDTCKHLEWNSPGRQDDFRRMVATRDTSGLADDLGKPASLCSALARHSDHACWMDHDVFHDGFHSPSHPVKAVLGKRGQE